MVSTHCFVMPCPLACGSATVVPFVHALVLCSLGCQTASTPRPTVMKQSCFTSLVVCSCFLRVSSISFVRFCLYDIIMLTTGIAAFTSHICLKYVSSQTQIHSTHVWCRYPFSGVNQRKSQKISCEDDPFLPVVRGIDDLS